MMGMILVDNMGPVSHPPWWLDHAEWHGLTPADLIFPAFLFIMGMAVPLAVNKNKPVKIRNILRIAGLFLIGFFLNLLGKKFDFSLGKITYT
jgi:predicted acyltransferase